MDLRITKEEQEQNKTQDNSQKEDLYSKLFKLQSQLSQEKQKNELNQEKIQKLETENKLQKIKFEEELQMIKNQSDYINQLNEKEQQYQQLEEEFAFNLEELKLLKYHITQLESNYDFLKKQFLDTNKLQQAENNKLQQIIKDLTQNQQKELEKCQSEYLQKFEINQSLIISYTKEIENLNMALKKQQQAINEYLQLNETCDIDQQIKEFLKEDYNKEKIESSSCNKDEIAISISNPNQNETLIQALNSISISQEVNFEESSAKQLKITDQTQLKLDKQLTQQNKKKLIPKNIFI